MTRFTSQPVTINAGDSAVYSFLNNFNNFEKLMPEQVVNWQSTEEKCSFTIKGMADLSLVMGQNEENRKVVYDSDANSPFPFQLGFDISPEGASAAVVIASLEARLNPMLKMMASRPLQNFINMLVEKLKEVMELS